MNNGPDKTMGGDRTERDGGSENDFAGSENDVLGTENELSEPATEAMLRLHMGEPLALPAGFQERVLARATAEAKADGDGESHSKPDRTPAEVLAFPRAAMWRRVAAGVLAASVLAGTFGVETARRHRAASREARERVVANQQFEQATRITDAALAHTREQLQRAGVLENEGRW